MTKITTHRGTGKKVLIVEDDKDFLNILKIKFESEGFSVVTAEDGEGGAIVAQNEKPALVVSDVLLPKVDGIEMVKKIKKFDKNISILFLTNVKEVDYIKKIEESGGFDYLVKSDSQISDIVDRVKSKLGIK